MIESEPRNPVDEKKNPEIQVIWQLNMANLIDYSLVKVSIDTPIYISYKDPLSEEELTLFPINKNNSWQMQGLIHAQTFYDLNIFDFPRNREDEKKLDDHQLDTIQHFGDIARRPDNMYLININLFNSRIQSFLDKNWGANKEDISKLIKYPICIGDNPSDTYRILPQQIPRIKSGDDAATITVNKFQLQ